MNAPVPANPPPGVTHASTARRSTGAASLLIATGILLSRVFGLFREALKTRYLGAGMQSDAFNAAFRIPNLLQYLFGEGVLSASFIPVYANLLARGDEREAGRVAGAVAAILGLVTALLVLLGVLLAPYIVVLIVPGFHGEKRDLAIRLLRVLFPGAGVLVLSAWCLGVLNSHRKFLVSYSAPVLWNLAMIGCLLWLGAREDLTRLAVALAWASVVGAVLQFLVQLPSVLRLVPQLRAVLDTASASVRTVVRNFVPVFFSRGVVQISAFIDQLLSSFLPNGAVTMLFAAQTIALLPVSLFAMAISAAELPEMSSAVGTAEQVAEILRGRLTDGLRRIAFFVAPSALCFLVLGDVIVGALYQHGRWTPTYTRFTWGILAGSAVGLLASTLGRLYSSTYYALHDTRTPLRFAVIRVLLTSALGYLFAIPLPALLHVDPLWGTAGLTASAGLAGWVEFILLRARMNRKIGVTGVPPRYIARLWASAAVAGACGFGLKQVVGGSSRIVGAVVVLGGYGLIYLALTYLQSIPEARGVVARLRRR